MPRLLVRPHKELKEKLDEVLALDAYLFAETIKIDTRIAVGIKTGMARGLYFALGGDMFNRPVPGKPCKLTPDGRLELT